MESGGEGNACSSRTGLGYPTDPKCEREEGGGVGDGHHGAQQQRHSKRHVTFVERTSGDEEQRTRSGHQAHDKVLRSHTRRANNNGSGLVVTPVVEVKQVLRQRTTSVTKRGLTWKEDEHSGLSSSEEGDRRKRGGDPEWSGSRGLVIPSSSTCSPPTNETVELSEQAGLGGTTHSKAGSGAGSPSTTSTRTRRTSGARRRSRRGEHCSQPDVVATQSNTTTTNTTITSNSNNNRSPSPQVMISVVGGAVADSGRISEECCDEPETMCQEDDTPAPHHHPSCELPAQPSASNSPKSFTSSIVSEGASPACAGARSGIGPNSSHPSNSNNKPLPKEQDAETEETPSMQTVVKVENENCEGAAVEGESERGGQHRASVERRRSVSRSGQLPLTGHASARGQIGVGVIQKAQKNCEKWNVEDGRGGEQRSKNHENPEESHPQAICDNVSMPLLKTGNAAGKEGASTEVCVLAPLPTSFTCSTAPVKLATSGASTSTRNLRKTGGGSSASQKKQGGGGNPSVNKSSGGRSEVSGNRVSVTEKKKIVTTPAPMLLMNNLPYMGELTFDTRPRRGRKPKKADICHLISKNYGIHFPVAYLNLAAAAAAAPTTIPPPVIPSHLPRGHVPSAKSSQRRANNGNVNSCPTPAISLVGPSPAPAFCNKDVSIVPIIPSSWSPSSGRTPEKVQISGKNIVKPLSLAQQLSMLRPNSSSQQAISMFPIPTATSTSSQSRGQPPYKSEDEEDEDDDCGGDGLYPNRMEDDEGKGNQDGPLNLCMRDGRYKTFTVPYSGGKREVDERSTLDVRWRKSTRTLDQAQFGSSSFSPTTVQLGASKRNVTMLLPQEGEGMVRKVCKSAKLSGTQASSSNSNSTNSYRNSYRSNSSSVGTPSVNNLVRIEPIPNLSVSSSPSSMMEQGGRGLHSSANFSVAQRLHGRELMAGGSGNRGGATSPYGVTSPTIGGKSGKQQGSSRKKREVGLRGDIKISPCNPEASAGGSTSAAGAGPSGFSSFGGGTLFGQSTSGINEGAEVSICKFKFTGGAKPCLQEKKMLSVDSGGNFRFYTDKAAGGPASKLGKGQQTPSSTSATVTSYSASGSNYSGSGLAGGEFSGDGTGTECHFPLSSLPKSAKSMSMCMPYAGNNPGVSTITSAASKATTNLSSSTASSVGLPLPIPVTPTAEELQQLHLSINHAGQQSARGSSPYLAGEYSYSSSNSCSSSDNSNENLQGEGAKMELSPKSRFPSHTGTHHRHGTGGKLKRKRRTRKSLMREKLEKTFKEKGFLIQTQQLESAEGATYCKFRQLRKFTRYLFRSWKDYLPDHVKDISDKSGNNGNSNGENLPGSSQAALQQQSPPNSDVKRELTEESTQPGDGEEDEDMDSSDKEDIDNEDLRRADPEPTLISEKIRVAGGAASTDEEENGDEEDQVVLIEASRSQSQPKSRQPPAHSSLSTGSNQMGDDEASDEEEEELQVDS